MGIMSNKVTRRVALGSITAGLGGAVAVLYALKGRYQTELPSGQHGGKYREDPNYASDWEKYVKMLDVPIKKIEGPTKCVLSYRPQVGSTFRVISLTASYEENIYPVKYPAPPFWYTVTDGKVAVVPPIEDAKPALLVSARELVTKF